jgi:hypothetical protein
MKAVELTLPAPEDSGYAACHRAIHGGIRRCWTDCPGRRTAMPLTPFADDAASVSIDKLTIETGTDRPMQRRCWRSCRR